MYIPDAELPQWVSTQYILRIDEVFFKIIDEAVAQPVPGKVIPQFYYVDVFSCYHIPV
jgi:hypothetical protein